MVEAGVAAEETVVEEARARVITLWITPIVRENATEVTTSMQHRESAGHVTRRLQWMASGPANESVCSAAPAALTCDTRLKFSFVVVLV